MGFLLNNVFFRNFGSTEMKLITKESLFLIAACLPLTVLAQVSETSQPQGTPQVWSPSTNGGVPGLSNMLFVGTTDNSIDPTSTLNGAFAVAPDSGSATPAVPTGVWGATADIANRRILYTQSGGDDFEAGTDLYAISYDGGAPQLLGQITDVNGIQRMDGLAIVDGVLYGTAADGFTNGFFIIEMDTLFATQIAPFGQDVSVSGIDADPDTGIIYGVNDSTAQLVSIALDGTMTDVAPYPAGYTDIDGLAVGDGKAFLVTDEGSEPIAVYDLVNNVYLPSIASPFTGEDIFSAGAFAVEAGIDLPDPVEIPTINLWGMISMIGVLMFGSFFVMAGRRKADR
jgi:hypothetical protein